MSDNAPELKVTGIRYVPDTYKGEPCILSMLIIDLADEAYEADIHFDNGISADGLSEAMRTIFLSTGAMAKEVNIKSFRLKK